MAKYGVFVRFDVEAESAEEARDKVESALSYRCADKKEDISGWEVYEVEQA